MIELTWVLFFGYILYLVLEKKMNSRYISTFKYVIHVNGIRGKTSVCRLIDAGLRQEGYRVFTKTTGSTPFVVNTENQESLIKRHGSPTIKEQLKTIKQAHRESADILILECMAVNPTYQAVSQEQMVKSNITVITNVRHDHILDMGMDLDQIASALANTIPTNGVLFTADAHGEEYFKALCNKKGSLFIKSEPKEKDSFGIEENMALAYEVCKYIGVKQENFESCFITQKKDFGSHALYENVNHTGIDFLNLFSVNDPTSTSSLLNKYSPQKNYREIVFVFNNRSDRHDRLLLFCKYFFPAYTKYKVYIVGQDLPLAKRLLKQVGISQIITTKKWKDIYLLQSNTLVVGIGNIKNTGYDIITQLEQVAGHE